MKSTLAKIALAILLSSIARMGFGKDSVYIGNYLREAPNGIAWVVNDKAAFVLNPETNYDAKSFWPSTAAPDDTYHCSRLTHGTAHVLMEWGRLGNNVVGRISSDQQTSVDFGLGSGWPGWNSSFTVSKNGVTGTAQSDGVAVRWALEMSPAPAVSSSNITVTVPSDRPVHFVAGLDDLPALETVDRTLQAAAEKYTAKRPQATGDWGDFIGAIEDNMNNSRLYSSDNQRLAHVVSRGWGNAPNNAPYFCWDSFLTANLAAIDDPVTARETVRAILSCQSPEGLVPNVGHWGTRGASMDRSQPPVGSWCVWKMHQRYPDDLAFLREVYPKLVRWHDWWPKFRDAKHDGLLEWGTADGKFQDAQFETGWDDNLHFATARMEGETMNCYAIDLSAMWAMDAHYLALLADVLGKATDARRFRDEQAAMNQRINERLWNAESKTYCSRFWDNTVKPVPVPPAAFGTGFEGEYFSDVDLKNTAAKRHDETLRFDWQGVPPVKGLDANSWSVRWNGELTAPESGRYLFTVMADNGFRMTVNDRRVMERWRIYKVADQTVEINLEKGQKVPIAIEHFHRGPKNQFRLLVARLEPANGQFLTRITPMNFYPLCAGSPDAQRAKDVMELLTDPQKFWGQYRLPTLAYDDPDWHLQDYWRGHVWGPVNYIVFDGIKNYATPGQISDYGESCVSLFMTNWIAHGVCGENYMSTDGAQSRDSHYTWGALLCLIGLESIVDVDDQGQIVLNGAQNKTITLKNIPLLGRRFDVQTAPGSAVLLRDGKEILNAKNTIVRAKLRD